MTTVRSLHLKVEDAPTHSRKLSPPELAEIEARRRDRLITRCLIHMMRRASELDSIEACMSGDSCLLTHVKRNTFDRWEMTILNERGLASLPTTAYEASRLLRFIP